MQTQLAFIIKDLESAFENIVSKLKYSNRLVEIEHLLDINFGSQSAERFKLVSIDVFAFFEKLSYIKSALRKLPFISATEDGSEIILEWQSDKAKLYMSFYGDKKYSYYAKILDDNNAIKGEYFVDDHPFIGVDESENEIDSLFLELNDYFFQKERLAKSVSLDVDLGIASKFDLIFDKPEDNIENNTVYV